jgi:hypothetical protein
VSGDGVMGDCVAKKTAENIQMTSGAMHF